MEIKETLKIKNFFSIADFDWKIKKFNILTGDMGSGKSLCLKLLYFFEQVFDTTIFEAPIEKDSLTLDTLYNRLNVQFNKIFQCDNPEKYYKKTKIEYEFAMDNNIFDITCKWDDELKKLQWTSNYIKKYIEQWKSYFESPNKIGMADNVRSRIVEDINHDFPGALPFGAMFIPASRAIAALTENIQSSDFFFQHFKMLQEFALSMFRNSDKKKSVCNILNVRKIHIHETELKNKKLEFELHTGQKISPLALSSGQQELVYLLLLINELSHTSFQYGFGKSIFIEEPSTHLFPKGQKQTMEYLVDIFTDLQTESTLCRFFISTHSPYVLNVINNILDKGNLLQRIETLKHNNSAEIKKQLDDLPFSHLSMDAVSAYMIEADGHVTQMVSGETNNEYLYSNVIEQITRDISDESNKLLEIRNQLDALLAEAQDKEKE
jgi:ABC-type lipoprotein export system ATPase subunit